MDKFSELKAVERIHVITPEIFGDVVRADDYNALLAELEASNKRAAVDHEAACSLVVELSAAKERIAELSRLLAHNIERAKAAEAKLATPITAPDDGLDDCRDMWTKNCRDDFDTGYNFGLWRYEQNIRAAGFTVGDE